MSGVVVLAIGAQLTIATVAIALAIYARRELGELGRIYTGAWMGPLIVASVAIIGAIITAGAAA